MIDELESLIGPESDLEEFRKLYFYVRSAILFGDELEGTFENRSPFNIERLVSVLDELIMKERHALYPFVGAWNPKLQEVAGDDFHNVRSFRSAIIQILRDRWVTLPKAESASYYHGLLRFQEEYEHPLRVFSLNYDLCVETACGYNRVQRGFADRIWDWRNFEETSEDRFPIMLYKLHGSLDWCFENGQTTFVDATQTINERDVAMIFGTSYKLQYLDPFLFLAYELRRRTLDAARLIICVGYGFNDEHINGILGQALQQNCKRMLLAVTGSGNEQDAKNWILNSLDVHESQILIQNVDARDFFQHKLNFDELNELSPIDVDLIPEVFE